MDHKSASGMYIYVYRCLYTYEVHVRYVIGTIDILTLTLYSTVPCWSACRNGERCTVPLRLSVQLLLCRAPYGNTHWQISRLRIVYAD